MYCFTSNELSERRGGARITTMDIVLMTVDKTESRFLLSNSLWKPLDFLNDHERWKIQTKILWHNKACDKSDDKKNYVKKY